MLSNAENILIREKPGFGRARGSLGVWFPCGEIRDPEREDSGEIGCFRSGFHQVGEDFIKLESRALGISSPLYGFNSGRRK